MDFLPGAWLVRVDDIRAVDDDGTAIPRRLAAARDEHPRRRDAGDRLVRGRVRAAVHRLQAGRRQVAHPDSKAGADRRPARRDTEDEPDANDRDRARIRPVRVRSVDRAPAPRSSRRSRVSRQRVSSATTKSQAGRHHASGNRSRPTALRRHRAAAESQRPLRDRRGAEALSIARRPIRRRADSARPRACRASRIARPIDERRPRRMGAQ